MRMHEPKSVLRVPDSRPERKAAALFQTYSRLCAQYVLCSCQQGRSLQVKVLWLPPLVLLALQASRPSAATRRRIGAWRAGFEPRNGRVRPASCHAQLLHAAAVWRWPRLGCTAQSLVELASRLCMVAKGMGTRREGSRHLLMACRRAQNLNQLAGGMVSGSHPAHALTCAFPPGKGMPVAAHI